MNCIRYHAPGGPDNLHYKQCPIPDALSPEEVLIKISATGILWPELFWPIYQRADGTYIQHTPCHDFSGVVVKVGAGWSDDKITVGSEVCAFTQKFTFDGGAMMRKYEGAAAEYAVATADTVAPKPRNLSMLEAGSVPLSALTAWQALHEQGQLQKGQKLLITGAAGATGLWAVQMAKLIGAHVVGTASSEWSFATLKELGVDEVIDYKSSALEDAVSDVDVVLDTVGMTADCAKVIKARGKIVSIVDQSAHEKSANAKWFVVEMKRDQLEQTVALLEEGKLRTFIDSAFSLERTTDAFKKAAAGHLQGKVMVKVAE